METDRFTPEISFFNVTNADTVVNTTVAVGPSYRLPAGGDPILSPRIIHFGPRGSLYFESREGVEHVETGFEQNYEPFPRLRRALRLLDQGNMAAITPETVRGVYKDWYEVVVRYSACSLTKPADKLVTLQGIARKCEELAGDTLTDGLWRKVAASACFG